VETNYWPLYEIEDGELSISFKPKEKKPLEEFLKPQGRFKHLFAPENASVLEELQAGVDREWQRLLKEAGEESE